MPAALTDEQWRALTRGAVRIEPEADLRERLASGRPLRVKLGLDPTARHVTLGWAVGLRTLRRFQDLGHTAVLIVGDYTARVGDPSGKSKTRPRLSAEEVDAYAENVLNQFRTVLDEENLEIRRNSEWLETLGTDGMLELASKATVAQMLHRDDFAGRFERHDPISVMELLYPLLQGYDSVAVEADVELGGTDQTFNLLVGRDLQRMAGQREQVIFTFDLLVGTDGVKKMSQSLGNYIAITEAPEEMFGKLMRIPDELISQYVLLATDLDAEDFDRRMKSGDLPAVEAKRLLAREIVRIYHGDQAAAGAQDHFDRLFREHRPPEQIAEMPIPPSCVDDGNVHLPALLKAVDLAASARDARRMIEQGGVHLDEEVLADFDVPAEKLRGRVVRVGRRRFLRLV